MYLTARYSGEPDVKMALAHTFSEGFPESDYPENSLQWGQYVFDPLAIYENWLLVGMGTEYKFTHLLM